MAKDFWRPYWVRGGRIEEMVLIGKDVLAWCTGVCIVFFNASQRRMNIRWCSTSFTGEGACCICSHAFHSVFAFVEKCRSPRILIHAYPSLTRIADCAKGSRNGYLATAFTSKDHLISISFDEYFTLIIWSWRTGERIATTNTGIYDDVGQILKTTYVGPIVVAQMGKTCGKLVTWDLEIVGKNVLLKDHEIILPKRAPAYWIDWCPSSIEPMLAVCDIDGHIYLSNLDGTNVHRIVLSQRCDVCVDIELPVICWFRGGIVLRTTFCQIRYYKIDSRTNVWHKEWHVKSVWKPYILVTHPFRNDRLFYYTLEGNLMQIDFAEDAEMPYIHRHLHNGGDYRSIDFVYPWCHHLVAIDHTRDLVVIECYIGMEISRLAMEFRGTVSCQASHPCWPMFAIVSTQGELLIVGLTKPDAPHIVARIYLQNGPLDLVRFSQSGRFLIVGEKETGICYVINTHGANPFSIVCQLQPMKRITDALIYEHHGSVKVLLLQVGIKQFSVGHQLLVFDVSETLKELGVLDLPNVFRTLHQVPGNADILIGSPYVTRQLLVMKMNNLKDVTVTDGFLSGHHVRRPDIFADRNWITTSSLDGLVIVRDKTVVHVVAILMPHHRHDLGTRKAITNVNADFVIALGHRGSLVAMKMQRTDGKESNTTTPGSEAPFFYRVDFADYDRQKARILLDYANLDSATLSLLSGPRQGFGTTNNEKDKTWTEWMAERKTDEERAECAEERVAILRDFAVLKSALVKLLDQNEAGAEIEKLPISEFDLDKVGRDQRSKVARDEREDVRLELESACSSMDRVAGWIKSTFWDPQTVIGQSIFSFFESTEVTNYPLTSDDPYADDFVRWAQFTRESVRRIIESETFVPWKLYGQSELEFQIRRPIKLYREDERQRMDVLFEEEEEKDVDPNVLEEQRAIEGMTTYRFVEQSPHYYSQMETYGCAQVIINNQLILGDCRKLRLHFNKLFNNVFAQKDREMAMLKERIGRIRYIDSELRTMYGQSVANIPPDPEWHAKENPNSVVRVLDHELKSRPYVSPSQQDIIEKQRAEAERLQRSLLADDFRERALMAMMNGVLEVRWEDVIKIDIPKPRCMIDKQPEQFSADDIAAVKQYEKDVQFLQQERERYKRILEADYAKMAVQFQEGVDKFNAKLDEFFQVKMKVEAALDQLNLRYVRGCVRIYRRARSLIEDDSMKEKIAEKESYLVTLREQLEIVRTVHQDHMNQYETLCAREKLMFKKFRSEFLNLGKTNVETLEKYYKRRPRTSLKNVGITDLIELGKHVIAQTKPINQVPECIEYLRQVDIIDSKPAILSVAIENDHWEHFVKLRRQRIDLELRIKAQSIEMNEADEAVKRFNTKITKCLSDIGGFREEMSRIREERIFADQNSELQLVLKMGQVEIHLRGHRKDTEHAILIPRQEIDDVNKLILAAADCKLEALNRTVDFHRGTLYEEWVHACLKMQVDNLREDFHWLSKVPLTREVQEHLKRKARGLKDNRTAQHLEKELDTMQESFAKVLREKVKRLEDVQARILAVRRSNDLLDRAIVKMNVVRCEMELSRDKAAEERNRLFVDRKMKIVTRRSNLIKKLQDNYVELLALQTEHELLRMKRYPELQYFKPIHRNDVGRC